MFEDSVDNNPFLQFVNETINKNHDGKTKAVGDRVLVWDSSRLTDLETGEVNRDPLDHRLLAHYKSIVIEDGCKYTATVTLNDNVYSKQLDIVIWNEVIGRKFRTSSDFTKLI